MDLLVTAWINAGAGSHPWLDPVLVALTEAGVPVMVALVALQWFSGPDRRHIRHVVVTAGLAFLSGLALNQIILLEVHRIRPYAAGITHLIVPPSADWSFPSDHATAAFAVVFAFALQGLRVRTAGFLVLAVLICLSRVYIGTHYVSDILGGMATALIATVIVRRTYVKDSRLDRFVTGIL